MISKTCSLLVVFLIPVIGLAQHPENQDLKLNNDKGLLWKDSNGTWRGQISTSGNLFKVTPMGSGQPLIFGDGTSGSSDTWFGGISGTGAPNDVPLIIKSSGRIGIGTNSPAEQIEVTQNFLLSNSSTLKWRDTSGFPRGQISTSGNLFRVTAMGSGQALVFGDGTSQKSDTWFGDIDGASAPSNVPLIIKASGKIGIKTNSPDYELDVNGTIHTKEVKVDMNGWPDFVFKNVYRIPTLEQVEEHINENGHLPDIPSEAEVTENGINLGEMDAKLLQKIEELTLYMIDMNKKMKTQAAEIQHLKSENSELKQKVKSLENE